MHPIQKILKKDCKQKKPAEAHLLNKQIRIEQLQLQASQDKQEFEKYKKESGAQIRKLQEEVKRLQTQSINDLHTKALVQCHPPAA
jgi:hypothetical protein